MSRYLGIDAGSRYVKTAVIEKGRLADKNLISAVEFSRNYLKKLKNSAAEFDGVGLTGYGRSLLLDKLDLPFCKKITEITAAAMGAEFEKRKISAILDIGGQDTKVIKVDKKYRISDFKLNDKCAAGTGKFIEMILNSLDIKIDSLKEVDIDQLNQPRINSTCAVFAETEVIQLHYGGYTEEELLSAVFKSIAKKVLSANSALIDSPLLFIGGAAKFKPLQRWLKKLAGVEVVVPQQYWFNNAIGAAAAALEKSKRKAHKNERN